jgi:hypothetical protein
VITADPRSRNQRTISRRSDGVSLGHETVTYAGPRHSRFMSAYRKDHPRCKIGEENSFAKCVGVKGSGYNYF